jgi:hypothetical protein
METKSCVGSDTAVSTGSVEVHRKLVGTSHVALLAPSSAARVFFGGRRVGARGLSFLGRACAERDDRDSKEASIQRAHGGGI